MLSLAWLLFSDPHRMSRSVVAACGLVLMEGNERCVWLAAWRLFVLWRRRRRLRVGRKRTAGRKNVLHISNFTHFSLPAVLLPFQSSLPFAAQKSSALSPC